jgi:hypothetical protein
MTYNWKYRISAIAVNLMHPIHSNRVHILLSKGASNILSYSKNLAIQVVVNVFNFQEKRE